MYGKAGARSGCSGRPAPAQPLERKATPQKAPCPPPGCWRRGARPPVERMPERERRRAGWNLAFPERAEGRLACVTWAHGRRRDGVWNEMGKRKQAKSPGGTCETTRMKRSRPCRSRGGWNSSAQEVGRSQRDQPGRSSSGHLCRRAPGTGSVPGVGSSAACACRAHDASREPDAGPACPVADSGAR